jgi:hypothetical protein
MSGVLEKSVEQYEAVLAWEDHKPGSASASVERLQHELANRRQLLLLLNQLLHDTMEGVAELNQHNKKFRAGLDTLKSLVGGKNAVPKEKVYPHFVQLSATWQQLVLTREGIAMHKRIFDELTPFLTSYTQALLPADAVMAQKAAQVIAEAKAAKEQSAEKGLSEGSFVKTLDTRNAADDKRAKDANNTTPVRLTKLTTPDFMSIPLEFQGYCPHTLATQGGMLLAGRPSIGIIAYRGAFYTFQSPSAMQAFCTDPEKTLSSVLRLVSQNAHLIHLLGLQERIPSFAIPLYLERKSLGNPGGGGGRAVARSVGTQSPTHFLKPGYNSQYTWNEWELRRRALQLASLTKKKTTSAQTVKSHFTRESSTQYTLPKPNPDGTMPGVSTQTRTSQGTNVPRTVRYMVGLRGRPDRKFEDQKTTRDGLEVVQNK